MADEPMVEKEFNQDLDVDKRVDEGGVLARFFIEVQGNDKEAAKEALESTVFDSLASEDNVSLLNVKMYELEKQDTENYSGVVEVRALFSNFRWFINTAMRYGPSAIEIVSPKSYTLQLEEMQSLVGDVSGLSQSYSSQIMALLKDEERRKLLQKKLKEQKQKGPKFPT